MTSKPDWADTEAERVLNEGWNAGGGGAWKGREAITNALREARRRGREDALHPTLALEHRFDALLMFIRHVLLWGDHAKRKQLDDLLSDAGQSILDEAEPTPPREK